MSERLLSSIILLLARSVAGAIAAGCGGAVATVTDGEIPTADAGPAALCAEFTRAMELGRVMPAALGEISGVAPSREQEDVLWVHNDSGGGARVFAIDPRGALLGEWVLPDASALDWEDIALEEIEGGPDRLWIGDVGDNAARDGSGVPREFVVVLRIDEPTIAPGVTTLEAVDSIVLRYPDGPHDCEAITVDPQSGDLYLFAKEAGGPSEMFVVRAPIDAGEERVAERVATLDTGSMITAADLARDGRELLVRTYRSVLWWRRDETETWEQALGRAGRMLPRAPEAQGEAVAFARGEGGYFTIAEGVGSPILFYERRCD